MIDNGYYTLQFRTEWTASDNYVISLYEVGHETPCGIVEVCVYKGVRKGDAYVWNLYINEEQRGRGYGRVLLREALDVAMLANCTKVKLEWDLRDSPQWVFDWYEREGFVEEGRIGDGFALMVKNPQDEIRD